MRFLPPQRGLIQNVPPHLVGPDALVDGNNVFVDLDGLLKTRRGSIQVGSTLVPAERVTGLASYEDNTGAFFSIAGTNTRWQVFEAAGWTDISGGSLLTGIETDQVRFTSFASAGINYVIGANNHDQLHQWNSTAVNYSVLGNSPVAREVTTLANRVVCFNTVEGGIRYPFRVRWSSINDQTTWGALNFADLLDEGSSIVGVATTSRLSCVIYRQFSAWFMQAVPGGDANAFAFDRVPSGDNMTGPTAPASIVRAEGSHFYFGTDGRIYQFDGSNIFPISDPVDPTLRSLYNNVEATCFNSCYVPAYRQLCFFFIANPFSDPMNCITFDLRRKAFEPIWTFPFAITASTEMRESAGTNWTNWVSGTATWLTEPWATWADIPSTGPQVLSCFIGDAGGNIYRFGVGNTDNGVTIPYFAKWGLQRGTDETQNSLVHYVEFYQIPSLTDDTIMASILGYFQPLAGTLNTIDSFQIDTSNQTTFYKTLSPGIGGTNNVTANLIQFIVSSVGSFGQFASAGATLILDVDFRGDPRQGVNQ